MSRLSYVRFLTYLAIAGIGLQLIPHRKFIPVRLAGKEDHRGILPAPGASSVVEDDYKARGWIEALFVHSWWSGLEESRLRVFLGEPFRDFAVAQPLPDTGVYQGVQRQLASKYPDYRADVRIMFWRRGERCYQAFFARPAGHWIVVDAVSWDENIAP